MSSIFKALSGGLTRFIYGWVMPSAVTVAVFGIFVLPYTPHWHATFSARGSAVLTTAGAFVLAVTLLTMLFAYTSLPLYRVLEGYKLPAFLRTRLLRRRYREWHSVRAMYERHIAGLPTGVFTTEDLARYPADRSDLLPTKLGNALRSMERYGNEAFGLDAIAFWYELQAVAGDNLRRDTEDARAGVDFFISAIAHLTLLAILAATVAVWSQSGVPAIVAVFAVVLLPLAYSQAVYNVGEWRSSMRALVNLGRQPLSTALGLRMPNTFEKECKMWESAGGLVDFADRRYWRDLNRRRLKG